jgi:hypothetical protein
MGGELTNHNQSLEDLGIRAGSSGKVPVGPGAVQHIAYWESPGRLFSVKMYETLTNLINHYSGCSYYLHIWLLFKSTASPPSATTPCPLLSNGVDPDFISSAPDRLAYHSSLIPAQVIWGLRNRKNQNPFSELREALQRFCWWIEQSAHQNKQ